MRIAVLLIDPKFAHNVGGALRACACWGAHDVFGPDDGGVPKGVRHWCHRFVTIPTANDGPLGLAAAVNVVLYDWAAKGRMP